MIQLDSEFLSDLGINIESKHQEAILLQFIYETLEKQVGMELAEDMSDEQLCEFEALMDADDEAGALDWLTLHAPDYKAVVERAVADVKTIVKENSAEIMAMLRDY